MVYYDLHAEIDDLEKAVKQASLLGFSGIAVAQPENKTQTVGDIELISSVFIKPKNKDDMKNEIEKYRKGAELVAVCGGDYDINRAACEDNRVDLLCHPERGRNDSGLDHICVKAAADNGVAIEINFNEVLNTRNRPKKLYFLQRNIYLCKKYGTKLVTTSGAKNVWEMRAPRELASLAHVLGLELKTAIDSVSTIPEEIIRINREKISGMRFGNTVIVNNRTTQN